MSGSLLAAVARPAFSRHETFHPRYGWLRKAYTAAAANPAVFLAPDATVRLGVGKNMVHAMRYWSQAYKVLEETPNAARPRVPLMSPTAFGTAVFDEVNGWDPFLEDPGTLWLLHWKLFSPPCLAPAWWVTFNAFSPHHFSEDQLVATIVEVAAAAGWPPVVESSVRKDVACVLRMYASRAQRRQTMDDVLDCPFRDLQLIEPVPGEAKMWRFAVSDSAAPPALVVAHACLDFIARLERSTSSMTVARLATEPGSPGCVFRLSESGLASALHEAGAVLRQLQLVDAMGRAQLLIDADPAELAEQALNEHYAVAHVPLAALR